MSSPPVDPVVNGDAFDVTSEHQSNYGRCRDLDLAAVIDARDLPKPRLLRRLFPGDRLDAHRLFSISISCGDTMKRTSAAVSNGGVVMWNETFPGL